MKPFGGALIVKVGGVRSTRTVRVESTRFPAASTAVKVIRWGPSTGGNPKLKRNVSADTVRTRPFTLTSEGDGSVIVPTMLIVSSRVTKFGCGAMIFSAGGVMSVDVMSRSMNPACFFGSVTTSVFEPGTGETLTIMT